MTDIFSLPIIQTLGLTLLHFLWQGSIIGIVLFIALCILRKPQIRYAVSCLALLTLAAFPVVTFANLYQLPKNNVIPVQENVIPITSELPADGVRLEPTPTPSEQPTQPFVDKSKLTLYLPWIVLSWFVGALTFSCKLLFSFITLQRYKTKGVKLAEQILQLKLLDFAKRLEVKQRITLLESKLVPVPVVLGWLRPVILLPTSAVTGLSPRQLEMLLAHELAHLLRRDYLVNVLQSLLESLLFYHPVVWWVSAQIRKEREYCCDDIAVSLTGDSQHYAQTLLTLAEMRVQLAPSASGGHLFTRISRLLQPLETEMRPSYWFAGLSVLGVLTALALTVVNVSTAQEDTPQLWATVVGDVEFSNEYSQINDMAPDAYIVIEERNGTEIKKVRMHVDTEDTSQTTFDLTESFEYTVNGQSAPFDRAWYEQAFKDTISHFYPQAPSENQSALEAQKYKDEINERNVFLVIETPEYFEHTFDNVLMEIWENEPTKEEMLSAYRENIRYQTQRYSAELLSDRSFAGYLEGLTTSPDFPSELFPGVIETTNEIKDVNLRQQLASLIETRSKTPEDKDSHLLFVQTESSIDELSGTITSKPSSDGKNRIFGKVTGNGEPLANFLVSVGMPIDAKTRASEGIASTRTNEDGKFSFTDFEFPSGDYVLVPLSEDETPGSFIPITLNGQELEVNIRVAKNFDTLEPTPGTTVSTTPTLSWEVVTDAVRYFVGVYNTETNEQFVFQMIDATSVTLELPLSPNSEYSWSVGAYNKTGKQINAAYGDSFKTE